MALLQFPDLSEIQQELVDINQRYDILGERLADRHQELRNIVENMQELLTWIDLKELDLNIQGGLPTSEREAKKQLKEHQVKEPVYLFENY